MNEQIQIREIRNTDTSAIYQLSLELSSTIELDLLKKQLAAIISDDSHFAYVAVLGQQVVGYIHCFLAIRLTTTPFLEIGGLVVKDEYRNRGIGKNLVEHIEQRATNVDKIRVRCNTKRASAHQFYLAQNYSETKEQKIFERLLKT